MKIEDYNKYYIQGSDHYLIPKDVFKELFNEMINWKEEVKELNKQLENYKKLGFKHLQDQNVELNKKYENAVADYETTMAEKEQLNSLVNSCQEEIRQLKKQVKDKTEDYERMKDNFDSKVDIITKIDTQQKEFIKWLENYLELFNYDNIDEQGYYDMFEEILQKYKEIIGNDINVGSI